jgi:hypothetical protein
MKADSTQPIATPVRYDRNQGACLDKFGLMMFKLMGWCSAVNSVDEAHQLGEQMVERINSHAALTQQVADLKAEVARLREALEFIGDHLEGEMGLLSADDYDPEFGTNETVILAFNKAMEALQSGRRIQVWQD